MRYYLGQLYIPLHNSLLPGHALLVNLINVLCGATILLIEHNTRRKRVSFKRGSLIHSSKRYAQGWLAPIHTALGSNRRCRDFWSLRLAELQVKLIWLPFVHPMWLRESFISSSRCHWIVFDGAVISKIILRSQGNWFLEALIFFHRHKSSILIVLARIRLLLF